MLALKEKKNLKRRDLIFFQFQFLVILISHFPPHLKFKIFLFVKPKDIYRVILFVKEYIE